MSPTREGVIAVARSQLGIHESPWGSNNVKYNTWYYGHPVSGPNYAWCAVGVSWVASVAGATKIIPRHAYTPSGVAWFRAHGRFASVPHVGGIVYYQFPGMSEVGHCGIVEQVFTDGSWIAIEFNTDAAGSPTGGQVMRKHRYSVGPQGGFGNPAYSTAPPPPRPPPKKKVDTMEWLAKTKGTQYSAVFLCNGHTRKHVLNSRHEDSIRERLRHFGFSDGISEYGPNELRDGIAGVLEPGSVDAPASEY